MAVIDCSEKGLKSPIRIHNLLQRSSWVRILLLVRNHAPLNFDAVLAVGCLAPQPFIGESCLHSSKPWVFFPIPGAESTSQITRAFFFLQASPYMPASHFPVPAASECHKT